MLLSDLCVYWGHRLQHNNAFLWRFHSIHHSAEHLDWLAAHREHPIDTIYTRTHIWRDDEERNLVVEWKEPQELIDAAHALGYRPPEAA